MLQFLKITLSTSLLLVVGSAMSDEPVKPKPAPKDKAEIEKLLAEFRKVYHLDKDQVIKRIKPPQPLGRLYDLDKWIPEFHVLSDGTYKEKNLRCLIYRHRDGKLEDKWRAATEGKRTLRRSIVARDRNDVTRYLIFAFFDSFEYGTFQ